MKKSLIALAAMSVVAAAAAPRARTHDVAYGYRMGAGFPGAVNRSHPVTINPCMLSQTVGVAPRAYGVPLLFDVSDNTLRGFKAADQSDATPVVIAGCLVRPFPVQAGTAAGAFGQQALSDVSAPVATVPNDYMSQGRMMAQVLGAGASSLTIDSDVYIWCSADAGANKQGYFTTAFDAGDTVKVSNAKYRGPADANGIVEIEVFGAAG